MQAFPPGTTPDVHSEDPRKSTSGSGREKGTTTFLSSSQTLHNKHLLSRVVQKPYPTRGKTFYPTPSSSSLSVSPKENKTKHNQQEIGLQRNRLEMMQPGKEVGGSGVWAGSYITGRGTEIFVMATHP